MSLVHYVLAYIGGVTYMVNWMAQRNKKAMERHKAESPSKDPGSTMPLVARPKVPDSTGRVVVLDEKPVAW
jgi:tRNA G10  N-methylase Trm11